MRVVICLCVLLYVSGCFVLLGVVEKCSVETLGSVAECWKVFLVGSCDSESQFIPTWQQNTCAA